MPTLTLAFLGQCVVVLLAIDSVNAESIAVGHVTGVWPLSSQLAAPTPAPSQGATAQPNPNLCPKSIEHVEFTQLAEVKESKIYSVDFDKIKLDGEKCSDPNPATDRFLIIPSQPAIGSLTNIPQVKSLDLSILFGSKFAGAQLQSYVDSLPDGDFLLGYDLAARTCGDQETPANTPYIFVAPKTDKTLVKAEGVVIKGGKDNMISMNEEALCVYSRSRKAAPAEAVSDTLDKIKACFPAAATVQLENGTRIGIDGLQIGDRVLVAPGVFSQVFAFTHREHSTVHTFLEISTTSGHSLVLSAGHYIPVEGSLKAARELRAGDPITLGDGAISLVEKVSYKRSIGLFNPQTMHGDIVVDGVLASTYTTAVDPDLAHAVLAPLRGFYDWFGLSTSVFERAANVLRQSTFEGPTTVQ